MRRNRSPAAALDGNQASEGRKGAENPLVALSGGSGAGLGLRVLAAVEGPRRLGLSLLDPRTGETVCL